MSRDVQVRRRRGRGRPRRERVRSCGKVRFRDHEEAVEHLHHAATARHTAEVVGLDTTLHAVRAYHCTTCQGFHVTSRPARVTV